MTTIAHLDFNQPAPDLEIAAAGDGKPVRLSSLWAAQPIILAFTRHFGCPQCKEMLDELVERLGEFEQSGLRLVLVTQAEPAAAKVFADQRAPGVLCLADPQRLAYRAYGLTEGTLLQTMLSPRIWRSNLRLAREKGYSTDLPPAGQNAFQMSGTFIIGRDGRVRLPYYYDDITDHPSVDLLLQGVLSTRWDEPFDGPLAAGQS